MSDEDKSLSRFLSLILRHKPETINLSIDENGWARVDELIQQAKMHNVSLTQDVLHGIVATNDKKRFIFSEDHQRIRANQGHSITVDLQLAETKPPEHLFHGTPLSALSSIKALGLLKGERHYVHLSGDQQTARSVGSRYGKPIVLRVNAGTMCMSGYKFYQFENGVWLTDHVPAMYLEFSV